MDELAQRVQGKVRTYLYRVTLDHDLTQDLSQDVLLTLLRSLRDLEDPGRFWPWLYRVAQSKIQEHYRIKQRMDRLIESKLSQDDMTPKREDALDRVISRDLVQKTLLAMKQLRTQYRAVLSLRCYDQLPYTDIADILDCTEVKARVLFFRAKTALRRQLGLKGIEKSLFLACLGVFGEMTAPRNASAAGVNTTVAISSATVGLGTAVVATVTSKATLASAAFVALMMALYALMHGVAAPSFPQRSEVQTIHFTVQARNHSAHNPTSSLSKGAYEQWVYFPQDINGPMFMRMQRWNASMTKKECAWLQNGRGNYYYNCVNKTVYISNYRLWLSSLRVRELPTDTEEITAFLNKVQGPVGRVQYTRDPGTGLLTEAVDERFVDAYGFQTDYQYNTLDPNFFAYQWSGDTPVVDERDAMHKRGWTWFKIRGRVGNRDLVGRGCLPFVYDMTRDHPAWLVLRIGNDLQITDDKSGARLIRSGQVEAVYPAGTFFHGLPRPWMGIHTVDLVRRDAAARRIWFETKPPPTEDDDEVDVTLHDSADYPRVTLDYDISLEKDLIQSIRLEDRAGIRGTLKFRYLNDAKDANEAFAPPAPTPAPPARLAKDKPGILWLFKLADDTLM